MGLFFKFMLSYDAFYHTDAKIFENNMDRWKNIIPKIIFVKNTIFYLFFSSVVLKIELKYARWKTNAQMIQVFKKKYLALVILIKFWKYIHKY